MSASNEWTEWHLTPKGWVRGTEKEDFRIINRDPPEDRVKSVVYKQFLSSIYSKMEETHRTDWVSKDGDSIAKFKAEFGPAPDHL
jgi:hypothetical protein